MEKISKQMELRVAQLDSDIMTTRRDPKIRELWSRLCLLHIKGIAYCRNNPGQDPAIVAYISKPQACISFLHLSEEETCCNRYLRRRKNA